MYYYKKWRHVQFLMRILEATQDLGISLMVSPTSKNDSRLNYCLYLTQKGLLNQHLYIDNADDPYSDGEYHFEITSHGQEILDTYKMLRDEMADNCNTIMETSRKQFPLFFCIILWIVGTLSVSFSQAFRINWLCDFAIGVMISLLSFWKSCTEAYWNHKNKKLQESIYNSFDL